MSSLRWRRARALALAVLAVVGVHAVLLFGLLPAWMDPGDGEVPPTAEAPVLAVRSVVLSAAPSVPAPPTAAPVVAARPAVPRPAPRAAREVGAALEAREPRERREARTVPLPPAAPAEPVGVAASEPAPAAEPADAAVTAAAPESAELPVYATRVPAAGTWRYTLERGLASGSATLAWQPAPDGSYRLGLEGFIAGVSVLDWASAGRLDAHGLAPERFAIRRRGRDAQAANFQRDAGIVTWSGPAHEIALLPGVQDRLSWLVQLPAIVDAHPERFAAGSRVTVMVIGARGGVDLWGFSVIGHDAVGETPALKLVRDARRPRETQVELWLDPARGHLPLRARLSQPEGGAPLELRLDASTAP